MMMNTIAKKDSNEALLRGFSFQELIDATQCNEPIINEASIIKTFNEIVKAQMIDANYELQKYMTEIIDMAK